MFLKKITYMYIIFKYVGIIGLCSCTVVFYWPRLQLPESQDFQLFAYNHPFELYDRKFKDQFWFEKSVPVNFLKFIQFIYY